MINQTETTRRPITDRGVYRTTPTQNEAATGIRILREADVIAMTGLSRTTIWRWGNDGSFPPPIRLGPPGSRAKGWRLGDIQDWYHNLSPAA